MSTRILKRSNSTALYVIAIVVIVVAFLLLGGGSCARGMMNGNGSIGLANLNWTQILISLGLGFLLGLLVSKRRR